MVPQTVLLECPEEIKTLAHTLETFHFKASFLENLLENILQCLKDRSDAYAKLDEFVEKIQHKEGDYVARYVNRIGRNIYHQLLDLKAYLPSGKLPYVYSEHKANNYLSLALYWENLEN